MKNENLIDDKVIDRNSDLGIYEIMNNNPYTVKNVVTILRSLKQLRNDDRLWLSKKIGIIGWWPYNNTSEYHQTIMYLLPEDIDLILAKKWTRKSMEDRVRLGLYEDVSTGWEADKHYMYNI